MEELSWAVRRYLEHAAAERPVALVVEDVHWAEPSLLELIEQLVHAIDDAPVLVLCPARPALVDESPDWGVGGARDSHRARAARCGGKPRDGREPPGRRRARPGCARPGGDGGGGQPALRRAAPAHARRRRRSPARERLLEGDWPAVRPTRPAHDPGSACSASRHARRETSGRSSNPPRSSATCSPTPPCRRSPRPRSAARRGRAHVARTEALRPTRRGGRRGAPSLPAHHDPRYRVRRHPQARAGRPPRAVRRLGRRGQPRPRERNSRRSSATTWSRRGRTSPNSARSTTAAARSARTGHGGWRRQGGAPSPEATSLPRRRCSAVRQPFSRSDHPERIRLLPEDGRGAAHDRPLRRRRPPSLDEAIDDSARLPVGRGARVARPTARSACARATPTNWRPEAVEEEIADAMSVFEQAEDEAGLAMAWRLLAWSAGTACRFGDAADASRARDRARAPGRTTSARSAARPRRTRAARSLGPTNVDEAIARCESCLEPTAGRPPVRGHPPRHARRPLRHAGRLRPCPRARDAGQALLEELGLDIDAARAGIEAWRIEMLAGDLDAAERELRAPTTPSTRSARSTSSRPWPASRADALERGAIEDAEALCDRSRELATDGDVETQALWRYVRGRTLARRRAFDEAEAIAREALASSRRPMRR